MSSRPAAVRTTAQGSRLTAAFGAGVFAAMMAMAIAVELLADPAEARGKGGGIEIAVVINAFVAPVAMLPYALGLVLFVRGPARRSARAQRFASFVLGVAVVPAAAALRFALGFVGPGLFPAIAAALLLSLLAPWLLARWR